MFRYRLRELAKLQSKKILGIADTGGWSTHYDWVVKHPARKIALIRRRTEINESLERMGFPGYTGKEYDRLTQLLTRIPRIRTFDWDSAMGSPKAFEFLTGQPCDRERTQDLLRLNIQLNDFADVCIEEVP